MRLTLRTLLAYMDGVLSPEEQEELKKQIEASELASELIHRTGDVVRRPQIGVPEVLGLGPIDDPNTMAEYLDGTLPDENVADFERACLDSEVMLAEAASAHHALKLVLSGEADVDMDTLKRMQWLPQLLQEANQLRVEAPHESDATASEKLVEATSVPPIQTKDRQQLPDYLRKQREQQQARAAWLRWAPAIASLILLVATAFLLFGPGTADKELANQQAKNTDASASSNEIESASPEEPLDKESINESSDTTAKDSMLDPSVNMDTVNMEQIAVEETADQADQANEPIAEVDSELSLSPSDDLEITVDSTVELTKDPTSTGSNLDPSDDLIDGSNLDATEDKATDTLEEANDVAMPATSDAVAEFSDSSEGESPDVLPVEPLKLIYIGPETSLLVVEREPEVWSRVSVDEEIPAGNRIISMPTYRPQMMLGENFKIEFADLGEATIDFDEPTELSEGKTSNDSELSIPSIDLSYGRLLLHNLSEESEVEVMLVLGVARCKLTIEPGLPVAIEADRNFVRGLDLLNQTPRLNIRVYAQGGNVTWEANGGIFKASQPKQWDLTAQGEPSELMDFVGDPGWIEGLNNNAWDRRASPQLPKRISTEKEVWPQLREIVESDSYKEVRALAAHCSLAVGHPDMLVISFDDESQQTSWARNLEKLRAAASRSQVEASRIYRAMEEQYGEKISSDLMVLLCGFSRADVGLTDEELQRGAFVQLIEWLESDSLACRVLSTLNLEQLTGRIAFYNPTDQSRRRGQDIRKIRKRLRENDLRLEAGVE